MNREEWKDFPAQQDSYEEMLSYALACADEAGVSMKRQLKLQLGFEEAVVNVISYAYEPEEEGKVWLKVYADGNDLIIEIKDSGKPFNPLTKEDALANRPESLEETEIGGLGIAFMRRVFIDIAYHYGEEDGLYCNHLTLRFPMSQ
ncbi:MAG: ATP-binding protein [Selenomonas ruminantium]|nr:ATP-binding protein [Selenomonas ruminantium]